MAFSIELSKLLDSYPTKSYLAGEMLLYQGEVPQAAMVVRSGYIKAYSISPAGEESIVNINTGGDIIPTAWVFDRASSTLYYYQAIIDCEVFIVSKDVLKALLFSNPKITKLVAEKYIQDFSASLMRITALEQARARDKIMFTLLFLIHRYGKEVVPGYFSLGLQLTHQTIADLVGLTRETTAVELSSLKKDKVLSYKRQKYLIKRDLLLKKMGEDSFTSLQL